MFHDALTVLNHLSYENRRPQSRGSFQDKQETSKKKKEGDDDDENKDNWELPDGDIPY